MATCKSCNGLGKRACDTCRTSGYENETTVCRACNGSGGHRCATCGGSGRTP